MYLSCHQLEESSSKEIERVKTLHSKQSAELADQVERLRQEKREMERDLLKQKAEIKGILATYLSASFGTRLHSLSLSLSLSLCVCVLSKI